jgi:hypothetical protein
MNEYIKMTGEVENEKILKKGDSRICCERFGGQSGYGGSPAGNRAENGTECA